jgi:hypothetical protein
MYVVKYQMYLFYTLSPMQYMAEIQIVPLISWSVVAAVLFAVVGLAYRAHMGKKRSADDSGLL